MKRTLAHCQIFFLGMDMECPLCGVKILSSQSHACSKWEAPPKPIAKPKPKAGSR